MNKCYNYLTQHKQFNIHNKISNEHKNVNNAIAHIHI